MFVFPVFNFSPSLTRLVARLSHSLVTCGFRCTQSSLMPTWTVFLGLVRDRFQGFCPYWLRFGCSCSSAWYIRCHPRDSVYQQTAIYLLLTPVVHYCVAHATLSTLCRSAHPPSIGSFTYIVYIEYFMTL